MHTNFLEKTAGEIRFQKSHITMPKWILALNMQLQRKLSFWTTLSTLSNHSCASPLLA